MRKNCLSNLLKAFKFIFLVTFGKFDSSRTSKYISLSTEGSLISRVHRLVRKNVSQTLRKVYGYILIVSVEYHFPLAKKETGSTDESRVVHKQYDVR